MHNLKETTQFSEAKYCSFVCSACSNGVRIDTAVLYYRLCPSEVLLFVIIQECAYRSYLFSVNLFRI